ncbi:DUF5330 domain-containing protein [Hoeflea olei]|nr:DUF5330 domain-containing protein [Hoeflea olei]
MWFLIKGSFWFSLVLITLPFLDSGSKEALDKAPPLEVGQSVAAAVEAFEDIRQICVRKPDVCATGSETFAALGIRAREGARIAYQFLDSQFSDSDTAAMTEVAGGDRDLVTGSLPATHTATQTE